MVVVLEVDRAAVAAPGGRLDVAVEAGRELAYLAAVAAHQVQARDLVALEAVVETGPGDVTPVGGDRRLVVRAQALGQGTQFSARHVDRVQLRVDGHQVRILAPVRGHDQLAPVGGPGQVTVLPVTVRELARAAAVGRHREHLPERVRQEAFAIGAVDDAVNRLQRFRPFRALGRLGEFDLERLALGRYAHE